MLSIMCATPWSEGPDAVLPLFPQNRDSNGRATRLSLAAHTDPNIPRRWPMPWALSRLAVAADKYDCVAVVGDWAGRWLKLAGEELGTGTLGRCSSGASELDGTDVRLGIESIDTSTETEKIMPPGVGDHKRNDNASATGSCTEAAVADPLHILAAQVRTSCKNGGSRARRQYSDDDAVSQHLRCHTELLSALASLLILAYVVDRPRAFRRFSALMFSVATEKSWLAWLKRATIIPDPAAHLVFRDGDLLSALCIHRQRLYDRFAALFGARIWGPAAFGPLWEYRGTECRERCAAVGVYAMESAAFMERRLPMREFGVTVAALEIHGGLKMDRPCGDERCTQCKDVEVRESTIDGAKAASGTGPADRGMAAVPASAAGTPEPLHLGRLLRHSWDEFERGLDSYGVCLDCFRNTCQPSCENEMYEERQPGKPGRPPKRRKRRCRVRHHPWPDFAVRSAPGRAMDCWLVEDFYRLAPR